LAQREEEREEERRGWLLASNGVEGGAVRDRERDYEQEEGKRL